MSKVVTLNQLKKQENKIIQSKKNSVLETEENKDDDDDLSTEEFYTGIFMKMKNIIEDLDEECVNANRKAIAYERAMQIHVEESRKDIGVRDSKIKLLTQEVEQYRNKNDKNRQGRGNVSSLVTQLYDIKDRRNQKKIDEGLDDLVANILKKARS